MAYPKEFVDYLVQFHGSRDYFECHEILEEYWKKTDAKNKSSHWVGFILLAVSAYHHRRDNFAGAERTARKSLHIMQNTPDQTIESLGIHYKQLIQLLETSIGKIEQKLPYESFHLPIKSIELRAICQAQCNSEGFNWCQPIQVSDSILHRHALRDRSDIIKERAIQKALREHSFYSN